MNKLLSYYQKELFFLKKQGIEFAKKYPKIARRLGYNQGVSEDPHIQRLTESFAFLSSRIHQRLDEDLPELMEALLRNLAPQFLCHYPSSCIVSFEPDRKSSGITSIYKVPSGTSIYTKHKSKTICQFRTVYPLTIVPATVNEAKIYYDNLSSLWKVELNLDVFDGANFSLDFIRFYLNGPSTVTGIIYTLLCNEIDNIVLQKNNDVLYGIRTNVSGAGFYDGEVTLPRTGNVSYIHNLTLDYFSFPERFNFIDIKFDSGIELCSGSSLRLVITLKSSAEKYELDKIERNISEGLFRVNCSPAVNLFEKKTEPLRLSDGQDEYQVNSDLYSRNEIFIWDISKVTLHRYENSLIRQYPLKNLFGLEHSVIQQSCNIFWHSSCYRMSSERRNFEENLYIRLSDDSGVQSRIMTGDVLSIDVICTNGDIPSSINNGDPDGDFDCDIDIAHLRITALNRPSRMLPAMTLKGMNWRIISQLSLNFVLLGGTDGAMKLREMLSIYNYNNNHSISIFIEWIKELQITPVSSRLPGIYPPVTARGIDITVILSKDADMHPECFMFCSFLDHFLGLHAPVNSFTRMITVIDHEDHTRRVWPIRAGKLSWL
ncbi:type VI secretion system baseplate subunit TssF [Escherichia coli]|uniref:type VI secretion system baseplate subunit TssF n=1 Tax=Escherichia coli TaxID=562 RepID=UPI0001CF6CE9|nr:type VI secretion system baseplate subunit TssF [Escherichia coli]EFE64210.1 type VI secretion protein [Escherichia coli B088]ELD1720231.1 type VI secretion system baseplate subunit TssF [Escherichia coli]ELO1653642.1 type VI secretion system baseplate subunit TssF [Escherichia coli]ELS7769715.1 type VI secretion system baseplate subunit TssF [Escherichia coli]MCV1688672.1 type VI secretion system baseplate subunit TssF [Escherichia coli]